MQRIDFRDQISGNKWKSFFLMLIVVVFIVALGYVISRAFSPVYFSFIMIIAIIFSIFYIMVGYYNSHKIAIASVGAKPASREKHKMFFDLVEGLTLASGLPMPKLYVMPCQQINAFASGRNPKKAVICVTEGALNKIEKNEIKRELLSYQRSILTKVTSNKPQIKPIKSPFISRLSNLFKAHSVTQITAFFGFL